MKKPAPAYETAELRKFGEILRGRRSIELFLQTPVPRQLVHEAIEAASWAPNHHVTEPWMFHLLGRRSIDACLELVRELVTAKKDAAAADFKVKNWAAKPGWMVVSCRKSDDALLQREDHAACAAAIQNFMLYLWKAGVGSKWTTGDITRERRFFDILGLDADAADVVGLIWYGYPKLTPTQQRKTVGDILVELP
ncbi:MAG: nitroreductase family protein [Gammaproteobacteria bacterium]|nr:nitroreductase family protein [Gammaproteobacteria bacterium]MDH5304772.1 nitroreductase family protein [Gammaproteobacteria bacterium]MDH5322405.1 nitroreductase family protein [Gammaproteobacteria bacterium]